MRTIDKKAFFFDFDGTIWFGHYGEKTLKALNDLHENGHLLFYNSGRSKGNTRFERLRQIPFDGFLYGGCHAETNSGKTLYQSNISKELMKETLEIEKEFDLLIIYEGANGVYKRRGILPQYNGDEQDDINVLLDVETYPMSKFSIIKKQNASGEFEPIPQGALDFLSKHYILIELGHYVECIQKGHGKDFIIKKVVNALGISIEDTFAFGDSLNDLPMFRVCAKSIAIGHSPDELKSHAVYVTKEEENGVWEALNALGFVD